MVVGFNHNFRYRGELFHVQTEDGGLKSPQIVTLLYRGGTILASKKTSYADITRSDKLEQVVEELMKEQHKEMLRRLKDGEFDDLIAGRRPAAPPAAVRSPAAATPAPPPPAPPVAPPPPLAAPVKERREAAPETSLDEIILSYLMGDEEKKG
jgi:hypothetical protein